MNKDQDIMHVGFTSKNLVCKKCRYGAITDPENSFCAFYDVKPYEIRCQGKDCPHFELFEKYAKQK